ncbi:hypothetical protein SEA_IBANTIK_23 [Streptomyces phage Ibantik]|uniref:Uncharacterized protein n=1 Tax=Streptomyces phage Ibantik TaxID=2182397 RepID=A0A2U8UNE1_9CAUD|nr:hypothetical protein QEH36_gp023 [Streptomyces phage Ibantik]AWN05247.1 hypothetical protein SEA_IBANTIK_23 [Streptomyces phage Ibantik]
MAALELTEELKQDIDSMALEDLTSSIVVEMTSKSLVSRETAEYLLETYRNRLMELYY